MARTFLLAAVAVGFLLVPGGATYSQMSAENAIRASTVLEKLVSLLHGTRVEYEKDLQTTPLSEVLQDLSSRYQVMFVINKAAFAEAAEQVTDAKATRLAATKMEGLWFVSFLDLYLRGLSTPDVTYLVRPDHIEITTREAAQKEAGLQEAVDEAKVSGDQTELVRAKARLNLPLVCVVVENRPLNLVLNVLARVYGLNIVIDPQVREQTKLQLTERLLNVPADTALELLAGQAGLVVTRKGNTFRITTGGAQ